MKPLVDMNAAWKQAKKERKKKNDSTSVNPPEPFFLSIDLSIGWFWSCHKKLQAVRATWMVCHKYMMHLKFKTYHELQSIGALQNDKYQKRPNYVSYPLVKCVHGLLWRNWSHAVFSPHIKSNMFNATWNVQMHENKILKILENGTPLSYILEEWGDPTYPV